jgi:hypothetical protein
MLTADGTERSRHTPCAVCHVTAHGVCLLRLVDKLLMKRQPDVSLEAAVDSIGRCVWDAGRLSGLNPL